MKHLGDITRISGYDIPSPDVVVGGSPCQDLSTAGKRAGLAGERSGLFMEQIRIIKELRDNDRLHGWSNQSVRFMVWENVPGAMSSGNPKGEDFRIVLEETARVKDPNAVIPRPPNGKWTKAGAVLGEGWSIAWRILDAQFWGVPQRRRRIALVADFAGECAPEVLFVRRGAEGDQSTCKPVRQDDTGVSAESIGQCYTAYCIGNGQAHQLYLQETVGALNTLHDQQRVLTSKAFRKTTHPHNRQEGQTFEPAETADTLNAYDMGSITTPTLVTDTTYDVRRLTPTECERLQGFPDGYTDIGEWTDSKGKKRKTTDSARYKALGNSIALPPWKWVMKRISAQFERDATLGSLFDGIGWFPYLWEQINGRGSCLWASEIEEFPIAVTERRINGKEENVLKRDSLE